MTTKELTEAVNEICKRLDCMGGKVERFTTELQTIKDEQKEQKADIRELSRLVVAVERLAASTESIKVNVDKLDAKLDRYGARMDTVEQKPAKRWESLVGYVLSAVVGGVVVYLFSLIAK